MGFLRTHYFEVISGRQQGLSSSLIRGLLSLLSIPYLCAVGLRNAYYRLWKPAARRFPLPVISIGNITVGGTGKTPVAAHVANLLIQRHRKVAILLRGYKGRPVDLGESNRKQAAERWRMESDEALVLQRRCPSARVIADPDRVAGARQAVDRGCNAIVLDDGFQHRRIARDLDIVLVDATAPFGFNRVLPRGLLREPLNSLGRSGILVLTRSDEIDKTNKSLLLLRLKQLSGGKPVIQAKHRIVGFTDVKGHVVPVDDPTVMQAVIFAGIANFESFRRSVEAIGVKVLAAYQYPDHHDYTQEELAGLHDVAVGLEANVILTTEKDAVKLVGRWTDGAPAWSDLPEGCRLLALQLEIEFDPESEKILSDAIDAVLAKPPEK
jgi:tetraacyldisaccharide 4'-kinase